MIDVAGDGVNVEEAGDAEISRQSKQPEYLLTL
jgi:hypothetical protein